MKVEIQGGQADHFRGYGPAKATRSPTVEEHIARSQEGKAPYGKGDKIEYEVDDVLVEDEVSGGKFKISAKGKRLSRIVFFAGSGDKATVVGSVEVDGSGPFDIELVPAA